MQPEPQALVLKAPKSLTGLFLIVSDSTACTAAVVEQIEQQGGQTAILFPSNLIEQETLAAKLSELKERHGSLRGIVNLAGLTLTPEAEDLEQWRQYSAAHCRGFFSLLHLCAAEFTRAEKAAKADLWLMNVTRFGGYFGRQHYTADAPPLAGAGLGLMKTLSKEWPAVTAKALDFDEAISPRAIAQTIIQELQQPGRLEVGYPGGNRTIFRTVEAPLETASQAASPHLTPAADWVVLVTGGAKGITAEVTADLAKTGLQLVIVGRSPLPQPEASDTLGVEDDAQLRQRLLAAAKASGETFTPVEIEKRLRRLKGNRAMRHHLEQFQALGATVDYRSLDVRDESAIRDLMFDIYHQYGRLDAVIHGAGVIEDKLLINKSLESYDRVFETKVDSAYLLTQHLRPERLKLLVFFSSVAGRYGNPGQSDYAAANEVLMRLACQLDARWPQTRVVSVAWGPWDGDGMASEQVKAQFKKQGIVPIAIAGGKAFLQQEIAYGLKGACEVIAGEGPWEQHEAIAEVAPEAAAQVAQPVGPLMRQPLYAEAEGEWLGEQVLSLASDRYLSDHRLDNQPVLPATAALEWLAEIAQTAAQTIAPGWTISQLQDLRLLSGITLTNEQPRAVKLSAAVLATDLNSPSPSPSPANGSASAPANTLTITAQLADPQTKRLHYRAKVELQPQLSLQPTPALDPLGNSEVLSGASVYQQYLFHGPDFQGIKHLKISPVGIDAQLTLSTPKQWGLSSEQPWIFNPGLLDIGPQLAIVWLRHYRQTTALPAHFPTVIRHRSEPLLSQAKVHFRVVKEDAFNIVYTATFTDAQGQPYYSLLNAQSICNSSLNRLSN